MNASCWDRFKSYLESKGYQVLAPSWPYKDRSVQALRDNPDQQLAHLGVKEIVDHYDRIIRSLPEKPVIIGHSFGGLFVQMLLDRGLGRAGIAIDPAPPKGVFALYPSSVWALRLLLITPFAWKKILRWPFNHFQNGFVHTLPLDQQKNEYETYTIPETGRIFWQAAMSMFNDVTKVNFKNNSRSPLLIIAGQKDRIVPAAMNRSNYKKYSDSTAKTDFKEFPNRVHWIIAEPGYEEVAEYSINWGEQVSQ
jgi:pimeloyl-ACP methyl ester carboxylesterase